MPDVTSVAGAAAIPVTAGLGDLSRFDKFFGGVQTDPAAVQVLEGTVPPASKPEPIQGEVAPQTPAAPPVPEPVVEAKPIGGLADKIRADREAKASAARKVEEDNTYKSKYEQAQAALARLSKSDIVADTIGWAEANQLTREEQAAIGETLLYGLVPDKATPEVRIKLLEARQARKEKLAEQSRAQEQERHQQAQVQQVHEQYIEALATNVESLPQGALPDSEAWFGGDQEAYVNSLYATANNLAENARAQGRVADLSFEAVAKVLESDISARAQRLRTRGVAAPKQEPAVVQATGKQPDEPQIVLSTKGLGGGAPRPPATTDAERMQRAMEAAFRTR